MAEVMLSPAEFEKIPLEFIIASPLLTTIKAHQLAALTTLNFINSIKGETAKFLLKVKNVDDHGVEVSSEREIEVPLLSIVKVPSLNFDSLSVSFNYNISQVYKETETSNQAGNINIGTTGILSKFVNASLTGSITHSRSSENVANRGGSLEVKLHVSESQLPAGLEKIINAMVESIEIPNNPAKSGKKNSDKP